MLPILVLKDGQIVEQGNHKELVALDGIFASMWADQVSSAEDHATSIHSKPEVSGYHVGSASVDESHKADREPSVLEPTNAHGDVPASSDGTDPSQPAEKDAQQGDTSTPAVVAFPASEPEEVQDGPSAKESTSHEEEAPTESAAPSSPPITFPSSDVATPASPPPPGVTFETTATPPRSGTPDPDSEPKRKRISSQNFQRIAKRISISGRRQGSASGTISSLIPGLKKDASPKVSTDEGRASSSARGSHDSPSPSVADSETKNKKKEKRRKTQS
ncbi:ATP-binding cassette-type vacuolar membrane transporter Hmt1 [Marasmius tenuissimus]|uniref:ATP-binding cassette-type vacuolar membrane transporter Hmt1 n=1 Tax=Marasmius tenuissimus TaxID=585030 RepID=A0ABR3AHB3_9AGAR